MLNAALADLFDRYARIDPEPQCWLDFEDGGDGHSHCLRCIKKLDKGRNRFTVTGGAPEEDGCVHCGTCGKVLDYTLTDAGVQRELDHFRSVKFRRGKPLNRVDAFHLARMIAALPADREVIQIAASAIRCMGRLPAINPT